MTYFFINPVHKIASNFEEELQKQGFVCIENSFNLLKEYEAFFINEAQAQSTIDSRCPKAVDFLKTSFKDKNLTFSKQIPILIKTSILIKNSLNEEDELNVLCPCKSLADFGNALNIQKLHFFDAKTLKEKLNLNIKYKKLNNSPVSLNYNPVRHIKLSQKSKIKRYFHKNKNQNYGFIELLYCKNGCHNSSEL